MFLIDNDVNDVNFQCFTYKETPSFDMVRYVDCRGVKDIGSVSQTIILDIQEWLKLSNNW